MFGEDLLVGMLGKRTVEPVEYHFYEVGLETVVINGVKLLHLYQLVVEPTHLKDIRPNGFIFPKFRDENKKCLKPLSTYRL